MILRCSICGGAYNNATPDSMLAGIKTLSKHGECLKCDIVSYMGEYILRIGTEDFVADHPNAAPECLTHEPEKADETAQQWIVTKYHDSPSLRPSQLSLFN